MNTWLKRCFISTLFISVLASTIVFYIIMLVNNEKTISFQRYLIDTPGCKIPDIDPFDPSIRWLLTKGQTLTCGPSPGFTYMINTTVYVNQVILSRPYLIKFSHCDSDTIIKSHTSDNKYRLVRNNANFTHSYKLTSEFTRVRCYNIKNHLIHVNFFAIISRIPKLNPIFSTYVNVHLNETRNVYNVILVGIEATTRLNSIRHLKRTRDFLQNTMDATEMTGYNKVGSNTFPNLVAMLTGKTEVELPWNGFRDRYKPFDKYDFIFKHYKSRGYGTLYAEDAAKIGTFNYYKEGFHKQPTDHYPRAIALAMEDDTSIWDRLKYCIHERPEQKFYLDYFYRFADTYSSVNRPYFGLTFLSRVTHDYLNNPALIDGFHAEFLSKLHTDGLLNRSIVFYFGDHGMRYGRIRDTYVGRVEARLPFMFVYLPPEFREKYPHLYNNVRLNAQRLTTPFDIHKTLLDILNLKHSSVGRPGKLKSRGISLFSEIPSSRTCRHAGIEEHYCACSNQQSISVTDPLIHQLSSFSVDHLNNLVAKHNSHICAVLKLDSITSAYTITPNTKHDQNDDISHLRESTHFFEISFDVSPGGGKFEALVTHRPMSPENNMSISGDISRINRYGDTSWCVNEVGLKKYCYCKQTHPTT